MSQEEQHIVTPDDFCRIVIIPVEADANGQLPERKLASAEIVFGKGAGWLANMKIQEFSILKGKRELSVLGPVRDYTDRQEKKHYVPIFCSIDAGLRGLPEAVRKPFVEAFERALHNA